MPRASLTWDAAPSGATAVVLVLHGGAATGRARNRPWSHAVLRLVPISRALARRAPGRLAVARLRFGIRGWNGDERSPVADVRWALDEVRARYPGRPIAVVGHSMGGRAAVHVADDPDVRLVVGLATWVTADDPVPLRGDVRWVFLHGDRDRICPIGATRSFVDRLRRAGHDASLVSVTGSDHAMLVRWRLWTTLICEVMAVGLALHPPQSGTRMPGSLGSVGSVGSVVASAVSGQGGITSI